MKLTTLRAQPTELSVVPEDKVVEPFEDEVVELRKKRID